MSWVRIWVHLVFSAKNREPWLNTMELRQSLYQHIHENAKKKDIWLGSIGGYTDHIHCLITLGREQTMSKIAQLIKGESSFWLNKTCFEQPKFQWQDDFWAISVSESQLNAVQSYILNKGEHHSKKTFTEEVEEFMNKYGWSFKQEK